MSRNPLAAATLIICAAAPVLAFDTGEVELSYGSISGDPGSFTAARFAGETALDLGAWGVQLGATLSHLTDADQNSARVIVFRDITSFRLGLSAARVSFDGAESDTAAYSFHIRWTAPGTHVDAAITAPDHLDDTGAFSYDISGEQALGRRLAVTTDLYRLSTDLEIDDFWSIGLGLRYAATDRLSLTAAGIRSTADDYNFDNRMARLGLDWELTEGTTASARLLHLVTDDDGSQTGIEFLLTRAIGPAAETDRLFDSGPLTDRFAIGAFEP